MCFTRTKGGTYESKRKNELSPARILAHASAEFAQHGYHGASVNRIFKIGKISKGLLYHYYKDKDDLYPACVKLCFSKLVEMALNKLDRESITAAESFDSRAAYFGENPVHDYLYLDPICSLCL